jgi:hypothetical protein
MLKINSFVLFPFFYAAFVAEVLLTALISHSKNNGLHLMKQIPVSKTIL